MLYLHKKGSQQRSHTNKEKKNIKEIRGFEKKN